MLNSFFRSAAEIFARQFVLLFGQLQRVGPLPLGIELRLQSRNLLFSVSTSALRAGGA